MYHPELSYPKSLAVFKQNIYVLFEGDKVKILKKDASGNWSIILPEDRFLVGGDPNIHAPIWLAILRDIFI
ncbi:hypothetical protein [Thermosulfurimonas dismutans]|uniref:Uncharacterized protein n=1 Tax=Thermosulfurimonas dismutans TaxID=999894 RepID=A0A179D174_9BACT|nr:hypothetical protein [Thermosulfurimonas dismutans]OAQ19815.1 hypothetical protein TDIS_2090 [Thermosulfurimonas dismutans]